MEILKDWQSQLFELISSLPGNFIETITNPLSIFTIVGIIIILFILFKIKKVHFTSTMITRIAIALALATVLKIFRIYHLPQGGSITLGSMVPILIIAFLYGPLIGSLTGFIYGIITLFMDPFILSPVQVLFDYPLPFLVLGVAGFFKNKKVLGAFIAIFLRFVCHFISGIAFFGSYAPEGMSTVIYSLTVNGSFIAIEGLICLIIIKFLPFERINKEL